MKHSNDDVLANLLAECDDLLAQGVSLEACLGRYPDHQATLAPLLATIVELRRARAVPARAAEEVTRRRADFMAAVHRLKRQPTAHPVVIWWQAFWADLLNAFRGFGPRLAPSGLLALLMFVILSGVMATGAIRASAKTLPGDWLYPVKTALESVQLFIAFDEDQRDVLRDRFAERRLAELRSVQELRRPVRALPLDGEIEAIRGSGWIVSGLEIVIGPTTRITGTPQIGAQVSGTLSAPGDGSLIAQYIEVVKPPTPPSPTPSPTATATRQLATATITPTVAPAAAGAAPASPLEIGAEPVDRPSPTATHSPTATATATRTRLPTATQTLTPVPSATPTYSTPSRPARKFVIEGWVERIEGSRWTVNGTTFNTDGNTEFIGSPTLGWRVSAQLRAESNGSYYALRIVALAPPEATPEPFEFTDYVREIAGEWWTIGNFRVRTMPDTVYEDDPIVGDMVEVKALRVTGGEIQALRITAIRGIEVQFEGRIDAIRSDSWIISGDVVFIDAGTQIIGEPAVGLTAEVTARQMPDRRVIARTIVIVNNTPTPTPETVAAGASPTATVTPTPTPTPTIAESTATLTPVLASPTVDVTATPTPDPTAVTP